MPEPAPTALSAATASDCLDRLGLAGRVLNPRIARLAAGMAAVGPAHTLQAVDAPGAPEDPYAGEVAAVDAIPAGAVVVIGTVSAAAIWGELLATAATARGAVGVVSDGPVRDTDQLVAMGFATFCGGRSPLDSQGRASIAAHAVPVRCGGVEVQPGDVIVADHDGVVAVPSSAWADVARLAAEKGEGEDAVRAALRAGESLRTVFDRHRVL
jgi:regulator of RNase E activity RraA